MFPGDGMVHRGACVVTDVEFTEHETAYLRSQLLGRLATVAPDGQPDNAAVGFRLEDDGTILVGGMRNTRTRKWRNVSAGNDRVAFVVDDLASTKPWRPRGIRVYGTAELVHTEGQFGPGSYLRITPEESWSWGIEPSASAGRFRPHRVEHDTRRPRGT
jgi:pyridoxamine 5'-phosphate oxidase family protein